MSEITLDLKSGLLEELYQHWCMLSDGIPYEEQIDPSCFPVKLFPYICLFEKDVKKGDFFAKLIGNAVLHYSTIELRHRYLDDFRICPQIGASVSWYYENVQKAAPASKEIIFTEDINHPVHAEELFLPYQNKNAEISKFLIAYGVKDDRHPHTLP